MAGYRADIDGLRAAAIVPVVAYHVGLPGFSGGYVGVDVFFVISGFLITRLLLGELDDRGRVDLFGFYARRVRRLFPALATVVLASAAAAPFLLTPAQLADFGGSVAATAGFVSNLFFWRNQDAYFRPDSELLPLLHTWTLAVEEQFYILWPLALIALAWAAPRAGPWARILVGALALGAAASFILNAVVIQWRPGAVFYLTPFRAWELAVGALIAVLKPRLRAPAGGGVALAGLLAIAAAVAILNEDTLFPGIAALAPVLGAAAVIVGGSAGGSPVSRLLGSRPLVLLGKLSYGWYLWHWPLLAFARASDLGARDLPRDAALGIAALGLAAASYRFIEQPGRRAALPRRWGARGVVAAGLAVMAVCGAVGAGAFAYGRAKTPKALLAPAEAIGPPECHRFPGPRMSLPPLERCRLGHEGADRAVLLWGDSRAQHLIPALEPLATGNQAALIQRTAANCRAQTLDAAGRGARAVIDRACADHNRAVLGGLPASIDAVGISGVILAGAWSADENFERGLGELVSGLRAQGLRVLLIGEGPMFPYPPADCLARRPPNSCRIDRRSLTGEIAATEALKRIAARVPGVRVWDSMDAVCGPRACAPTIGRQLAYRDQSHLTRAAAQGLAGALADPFLWVAGAGGP